MLVGLKKMVNMDLHFFKWMPHSISSEQSKSPTLLLFLHGMGGTGQIWRPIAANLEEEFLCIAPDQRGHGQSRLVPTEENDSFHASDYAKDIIKLLEKCVSDFHPEKLFIIGHSMGVRSGLATANAILDSKASSLRPLLKGFISIDIGLQSKWGGGIGKPLADFIETLPLSFPDRVSMREHLFKHCPDPAIAQYLAAVARQVNDEPVTWKFPFDHQALVKTIHQADEAPIDTWVMNICNAGIPVLALRGINSKVWLKKDYEHSRETLINPFLTFEEWENCGHGLPFEQRPRFIERVRDFCR